MQTISNQTKQEIIDLVKAGGRVRDIANQYKVSDRVIYTWLKKQVNSNLSPLEFSKLKKENQILKEIVGTLTIELERLKKKTN